MKKRMLVTVEIDLEIDYTQENYPGETLEEAAAGTVLSMNFEELLDGVTNISLVESREYPPPPAPGEDGIVYHDNEEKEEGV